MRPEISRRLIEAAQGGNPVLPYYSDRSWLRNSKLAGLDSSGRNDALTPP